MRNYIVWIRMGPTTHSPEGFDANKCRVQADSVDAAVKEWAKAVNHDDGLLEQKGQGVWTYWDWPIQVEQSDETYNPAPRS